MPVGAARNDPNTNPFLPPPVGRLTFSWNPFVLGSELCGTCVRTVLVLTHLIELCGTCIVVSLTCPFFLPFSSLQFSPLSLSLVLQFITKKIICFLLIPYINIGMANCAKFFCCLLCITFVVLMVFCQPFLTLMINIIFFFG